MSYQIIWVQHCLFFPVSTSSHIAISFPCFPVLTLKLGQKVTLKDTSLLSDSLPGTWCCILRHQNAMVMAFSDNTILGRGYAGQSVCPPTLQVEQLPLLPKGPQLNKRTGTQPCASCAAPGRAHGQHFVAFPSLLITVQRKYTGSSLRPYNNFIR